MGIGMNLLIAGLPATGKSSFTSFLSAEFGSVAYDLERYPEGWPNPELHHQWEASRSLFVSSLVQAHPAGVALDWGFPPVCLSWVEQLEAAGVSCIWFTGDLMRLRERFIARGTIPVDCFDAQVAAIKRAGLPGQHSWPVFNMLDRSGSSPCWEEIWRQIANPA